MIIPNAFPIAKALGSLFPRINSTTSPINKGKVPIPPFVKTMPNEPAMNPSRIPLIGKSEVLFNAKKQIPK